MQKIDAALFRAERDAGVLQEIRESGEPEFTVFVSCSDGDRFLDKHRHHCTVTRNDRHPVISNPGGVLLLHPKGAVNRLFHGDQKGDMQRLFYLLRKRMGQVPAPVAVTLCAHWPCLAAQDVGISASEILPLLAEVKRAVRGELQREFENPPSVSARIQLDWTGARSDMRTYQFKLKRWSERHERTPGAIAPRFPAAARVP